jgi:hypothetical protein
VIKGQDAASVQAELQALLNDSGGQVADLIKVRERDIRSAQPWPPTPFLHWHMNILSLSLCFTVV